jgi:hypothetical protein
MPATPISNPAPGESLVGTEPQLLQQVDPGWRHRLNLYTGRALTANALDSEQAYRTGLLATIGQSVTAGTAKGLELTMVANGADAVFTITPGYGFLANGEDVRLLSTMKTTLSTLAVIDSTSGKALVSFTEFAANPSNKLTAGVLLLQPITAQVSGQVMDTGTGPIEVSGNLGASCDQDPQEYAFEDWQIVDGARLVFFPWPVGVNALPLPDPAQQATWRSCLASTIFTAESLLGLDDVLPWNLLGVPVALIGFDSAWKPLFVDCASVVRPGGLPRRRFVLPTDPVLPPVWQPNTAFAVGEFVVDSNGNIQQVQIAGSSGGAPPAWNTNAGATTPGDGNVTWVNNGLGTWRPSTAFAPDEFIIDPNGNMQTVIAVQGAGKTGSSAPQWNAIYLPTLDGDITWINNGKGTPPIVQPALAQARISQLSEQLSFTVNQGTKINNLSDIFPTVPPAGILPATAFDFANRKNAWFPPNWTISVGPVHNEELETVLETSMTAEVIEAEATVPDSRLLEPVQVLVPLPDEVYDPDIMVVEEVAPEFQQEVNQATQSLNTILHRRRAIQLESNALLTALGPNSPSNPNLINPDSDLTATEIQVRNSPPPYSPESSETFGTVLPSTWQASTSYAGNQFVVDSNGNIQRVQTAGTSGTSQPTAWNTTVGDTTTDGTVTWINNGLWNWQPNTSYAAGQFIFDSNGNLQTVETSGMSAATPPTWNSKSGESTQDGITWANAGKASWQPRTVYTAGQAILDPYGNIQVVQYGGASGEVQPFLIASQQTTIDGEVTWSNTGRASWQPNTTYASGRTVLDSNGNVEIAQVGGVSGTIQPSWQQNLGQTTMEVAVVWTTGPTILWQAGTNYSIGQIIVDSNGNFQVAQTGGKSGTSQPVWSTSPGQVSDGSVAWSILTFTSLDIQQLQAQANQVPYTFTFKDGDQANQASNTAALLNSDDWNDFTTNGLQHFINRLNSKISQANDLIDQAFLTAQTDIYRYRRNVLDATTAQKLLVSPILANIASGDTATATAQNLQNYVGTILPPTTPTTPAPPPPPPPSPGGGNPISLIPLPFRYTPSPIKFTPTPLRFQHFTPLARAAMRMAAPVRFGGGGTTSLPVFNPPSGLRISPTTLGLAVKPSPIVSTISASLAGLASRPSLLSPSQVLVPGQNQPVTPVDIQGQSPIAGAQLNIRTLTVATRLAQSASQESLFYSVGNRLSFLQLLQMLATVLEISDLPMLVDGPQPTGAAATPAGALPVSAVPVETHTFSEWLDPVKQPDLLLKVKSPVVPSDSDEAGLFSVGVRVLEQHTMMLRSLEARVQQYVDFVALCNAALTNIQNNLQHANTLLGQINNDLSHARQSVTFTTSLLNDETNRVNGVNLQRAQTLQGVAVIAYTRPRSVEIDDGDTPSRQLVPGNVTSPVPACLQQSVAIPPELRELVNLLREAPVNWLPAVQSLLNNLERPSILQDFGASIASRAAFQMQLTPHVSSASGEPGAYSPFVSHLYTANQQMFHGFVAQRSTFQVSALTNLSWGSQVSILQNIAAMGDMISSDAVHTEVTNATTRSIQQIASVATCLYTRASLALPVDRLAWADFLTGPGLSIQMQSLAVLPNWNSQAYMDRQQMQMLVDWLFLQIDNSNGSAVAFMSDLVRTSIMLASDVPVDNVIASAVIVRTQPIVGNIVSLGLSSDRIAKGMYVQLYSGTDLAARAVVTDLDSTTVSATVTDSYKTNVYLEPSDTAHITTQAPHAAALRPFVNQI